MTFPVVGSNIPSAYQISNSLRFNDNDSAYLSRTPSSAGDRRTFTFSFWFKRGNIGGNQTIFSNQVDLFRIENDIFYFVFNGASSGYYYFTDVVFRDVSAWYHITLTIDTTDATGADRLKLYVNGERLTPSASSAPSQNYESAINNTQIQVIGKRQSNNDRYLDGYLSEFHFIDGTAKSPTDFGEFDASSGVWKPIQYAGTYGTNGFYLKFNNTGNMGEDSSGNDNTWTPTNLSGPTDVTTDTPTNNFCTMNPLIPNPIGTNHTFSEGNLKITGATSISGYAYSTYSLTQGKWYFEFRHLAGTPRAVFGDIDGSSQQGMYFQGTGPGGYVSKMVDNSGTTGTVTWANNDIIGLAFDFDAKTFKVFHNGTEVFDETYTIDVEYFAIISDNSSVRDAEGTFNFGQDSSFAGTETRQNNSDGNGYGDFYYTPPSGYLALCTQNLATALSPTIDDGSQYFQPITYSGNGGNQDISANFDIDLAWIKARTSAYNNTLIDTLRGNSNRLYTNTTDAESTLASPNEINLDGSTLDLNGGVSIYNKSGDNYVTWLWNAGGTGVSNTDGSITSTVSANTTAGFSIVTYTGTGASATVGHGLTKAPEMVICKQRTDAGTQWQTGHTGLTNWTYKLLLNSTAAESVNANVFPSAPTSTVINLGLAGDSNGSGKSQLIYAFHSVEGYSKFGSYTGNGSTDGTFIYTGFRPAFVIWKRTDSTQNWFMQDIARNTYNQVTKYLRADTSDSEGDSATFGADFVSNGFKIRGTGTGLNASGGTYIYMAFAENPFVTSGATPVTAR